MEDFYYSFHLQVKERINKYKRLYCFGEDSIRYDFYHTALRYFQLSPSDLMLEQPIPESQYVAKVRDKALLKQGRHTDKPEFDLRIDRNNCLERGLIVEFAYFRKTEISENQDKSGRHGKIFNEIHRLALLNHFRNEENNSYYNDFTNYDCLLICITDDEMINYGHNSRGRMAIPVQNRYELTEEYLSNFPDTVKNSINAIFKQKVKELKIIPTAKRIFEKNEEKNGETPQWATWIWKVSYKRNH